MRTKHLFVGALAVLVGACSQNKGGNDPPPPNKELLAGKWKNTSELQFLTGYEFAADGKAKVSFHALKEPVPARYAWADERNLNLEYRPSEDVRRAYKAAGKAWREELQARVKSGKMHPGGLAGLEATITEELPASQTFRVVLTEKPRTLYLTVEGRGTQSFKPD